MHVLIFTDSDPDYGADYLAHGFHAAGHEVYEFPRKPTLHWEDPATRVFDCYVNLPDHQLSAEALVRRLRMKEFDLIVVSSLRPAAVQAVLFVQQQGLLIANADRVVACDFEDHSHNTLRNFAGLLGFTPLREHAYFKRELPLGATWATPLPFGYPAERVVRGPTIREAKAFYGVHLWHWAETGMRGQIGEVLAREPVGDWSVVRLTHDKEYTRRELPHEYQQRLKQYLVAISPAGAGWGTNRHLEVVAMGCAPVLERPTVEFPHPFAKGSMAEYFTSAPEAATVARSLVTAPAKARRMAVAAQKHLLDYHTTRHRAETVIRAMQEE